jgi:hypothetical protein
MDPFPVIRVSGRLLETGSSISSFTIEGPKGARVAITCRGRSCPSARVTTTAPVKRLKQLERRYRAGTRLRIAVTQPGRIGKWTELTIRANRPPKRVDLCVAPDQSRPGRCPS